MKTASRGTSPSRPFSNSSSPARDVPIFAERRRVKGQRYPVTFSGAKTAWRRLLTRANVADFRFHDLRHDFATKLLRSSRNLKIVQKALNHADIKTTLRYAHVLDDEVGAAVAEMQDQQKRSRKKSRTGSRKAS